MTGPPREVRVLPELAAVARAAAEEWLLRARANLALSGRFDVALSGGATPLSLYRLLSDPGGPYRGALPWHATHVFFADERCVPPDHADSNYRAARDALLARVPVPPANVHRIRGEDEPERAARAYEGELRAALGPAPSLDLVLLGIGADGHTASLFPGSPLLDERARLVAPAVAPPTSPVAARVTLTYPALEGAGALVFLVAGATKASALARALAPGAEGDPVPAARVRSRHAPVLWLVDRAAAAELPPA